MSNSTNERELLEQEFENFNLDRPRSPHDALALLDRARGVCPVPFSKENGGFYALLTDEDVRKAMINWQTFASSPSAARPLAAQTEEQFRLPPIDFDGPEHAYWRKFFTDVITARQVARVRDRLRKDVIEIVDAMAGEGQADVAVQLGDVVPGLAVFYLLGIENADAQRATFLYARSLLASFSDPVQRSRAIEQIVAFAMSEVEQRRVIPRDDVLTALAAKMLDEHSITRDVCEKILMGLIAGGLGTTAAAIADLFHSVLSRPAIKQRLIENPELIPSAVEESLRLHAPSMGLYRRVTKDVEMHGTSLAEGSTILACWQAANLDPSAHECPHEFRLGRKDVGHFSFGMGRHFCPGSPLARMELNLVLETMLSRHPEIELQNAGSVRLEFVGMNEAAISSLPVVFMRSAGMGPVQ